MFHNDIAIFSVHPQTTSSGEIVTVEGSGFQISQSIFCHFGSQIFMGNVISPFHCQCVVPSGIEGNHSISMSLNAANNGVEDTLNVIEIVDHSFSVLQIVPSTVFVNREQMFTVVGSHFSVKTNFTVSSRCMQSGFATVLSSTLITVYMKPTSSGVCPVFVHNLKQSSQTGIVVLEALVVTQVTPNVLFPGKQLLSLRLSELALLLDTSLEICCSFADALSSTTQTNDGLACSLDVPQQNASSSTVSVQLVSCKTLESVSSSFEIFIQRLPEINSISPRMAMFGFGTLTISGAHFTTQLKCSFNFASSAAVILDPYSCLCPVPTHLAEYTGDMFISVLFQDNVLFSSTIHVVDNSFSADSNHFQLWNVQPQFFLNNEFITITVHGSNMSHSLVSTCCLDALQYEARVIHQNLAECKVFVDAPKEYQFKFLQGHYLSTAENVSVVAYSAPKLYLLTPSVLVSSKPSLIIVQVEHFIQSISRLDIRFGDYQNALGTPFFDIVESTILFNFNFDGFKPGNHSLDFFFGNDHVGSIHMLLLNRISLSSSATGIVAGGGKAAIPFNFSGYKFS